MTGFAFAILRMFGILGISGILGIIALFGLVSLCLYLPSLIITRLVFHLRRRKGPVTRCLSHPIGPLIPGRGAERGALRHALKRWSLVGLTSVPLAIVLGSALFMVSAAAWLTVAFGVVMSAALCASVVSGVECVSLFVRLALYGPRNPTDSLAPSDNSDPHRDGVNPPNDPRPPFSAARLAPPRAGEA